MHGQNNIKFSKSINNSEEIIFVYFVIDFDTNFKIVVRIRVVIYSVINGVGLFLNRAFWRQLFTHQRMHYYAN